MTHPNLYATLDDRPVAITKYTYDPGSPRSYWTPPEPSELWLEAGHWDDTEEPLTLDDLERLNDDEDEILLMENQIIDYEADMETECRIEMRHTDRHGGLRR